MGLLVPLLIGLAAGVCGGLFGIGGGILIVPALIGLLGFSQHRAQGTSLVALLAPVGAFALWDYWRKGSVDVKVGALVAVGFLAGGFVGALGANALDQAVLRKIFAGFLIVTAVWLLCQK